MNASSLNPPRPPGRFLALVVGLLLLPFVLAGALYASGWQPARLNHHGRLVEPPQQLPPLVRSDDGRWLLVYAPGASCEAACLQRIDELRRVQVALYKDMGRLRRVVLLDNAPSAALNRLAEQQPDLVLAPRPPGWPALQGIQLIDPQGWRVLDYADDVGARELRSDLERLLKPGRNA